MTDTPERMTPEAAQRIILGDEAGDLLAVAEYVAALAQRVESQADELSALRTKMIALEGELGDAEHENGLYERELLAEKARADALEKEAGLLREALRDVRRYGMDSYRIDGLGMWERVDALLADASTPSEADDHGR